MEIHWLFYLISACLKALAAWHRPLHSGLLKSWEATGSLWSMERNYWAGFSGGEILFHFICRLPQECRTLVILISFLFLTDSTSYKIFSPCLRSQSASIVMSLWGFSLRQWFFLGGCPDLSALSLTRVFRHQ